MRARGAPRTDARKALDAALAAGGGTSRMLADRSDIPAETARRLLDNMTRCGVVAKARSVRVDGCKRPVPWYEPSALVSCGTSAAVAALTLAWRQGAVTM